MPQIVNRNSLNFIIKYGRRASEKFSRRVVLLQHIR